MWLRASTPKFEIRDARDPGSIFHRGIFKKETCAAGIVEIRFAYADAPTPTKSNEKAATALECQSNAKSKAGLGGIIWTIMIVVFLFSRLCILTVALLGRWNWNICNWMERTHRHEKRIAFALRGARDLVIGNLSSDDLRFLDVHADGGDP
ncbi:hypothetical protein BCR34DRAFT_583006 [Clohesyomyces aquaticus]|uniref:Uncharacterized protein n=1 Tax=Clohesyomyces aquaticus TaxID=1231657 RepID=A0A1Y2A765_9PLEO|nr:hypothetical protein BCR34DRAFT_583006 [Clohesyomyces aquaticus]